MTPILAALRWLWRWDPTGWEAAAMVAAFAADEPSGSQA